MQFKSVSPGQFSRRITNTPVTSLCAYKKYFNHVLEIVILDPLNPKDLNLMLAAGLLFVVEISFPSLFFFLSFFFYNIDKNKQLYSWGTCNGENCIAMQRDNVFADV